jgi:hypothetical protein
VIDNAFKTYQAQQFLKRRQFLGSLSMGVGAAALSQLIDPLAALGSPLNPSLAPIAKAKRVIFLCMAGGPSHLELFDEKPKLAELDGTPMPDSFTAGMPIAQLQGKPLKCFGPQASFKRHGKSGQTISDFVPHIASIADDIAIVKSMVTDQINHDPAHAFMNTGTILPNRPSMGAWVNYGIGSLSNNLPGFVVLSSVGGRNPQPIASRQWSSGFLPSKYQGVEFHSAGDPVHYVANPHGTSRMQQEQLVSTVQKLDQQRTTQTHDPELASRIAQYELAFQMQASIPELTDISDESPETLAMYGAAPGDGSFASNCLLARRLAERGVRFIQLYHRGWDHHGDLKKFMGVCSGHCDQPTAALIKDLKQRGMLEDTLVIWGGEFGRTPMSQGSGESAGRDHHIKGFSMFLAGGGIKGGISHGATDDLGYAAVDDIVNVRDLHATMLHLLGIDHERLAVQYQGAHLKLTGLKPAHVVKQLIK